MALKEIRKLYGALVESSFNIVPVGQFHIQDIYRKVKGNYPTLCDDQYLCANNCSSGHNQPEWKHAVRRALYELKRIGSRVSKGQINYWIFN